MNSTKFKRLIKTRAKTLVNVFRFEAIVDGTTSEGIAYIDSVLGFSAPIALIKGSDTVIFDALQRAAYERPEQHSRVTRGAAEDYHLHPIPKPWTVQA